MHTHFQNFKIVTNFSIDLYFRVLFLKFLGNEYLITHHL